MSSRVEQSQAVTDREISKYANFNSLKIGKYGTKQRVAEGDELISRYTEKGVMQEIDQEIAKFARSTRYEKMQTFVRPTTSDIDTQLKKFTSKRTAVAKALPDKKTESEIVADAVVSDATTEEKVATILSQTAQKLREPMGESLLNMVYQSILSNARPILYYTALSVLLAVSISLIYIYVSAGSWMIFLNILKNLGIKVLPMIIIQTLRRTGVNVATNMSVSALIGLAEKNSAVAKILETRMETAFIKRTLSRVGVDTQNYDLSVKNLTRNAVSGGVSAAMGGMASYLLSKGVDKGVGFIKGATQASTKKNVVNIVRKLEKASDAIASEILNGETKTDALMLAQEVEAKVKLGLPARPSSATQLEEPKTITSMIAENKAMALGTASAISLVTLALTADISQLTEAIQQQMSSLGEHLPMMADMAQKGFDFVRENDKARFALFSILANKIGITKVTDLLIDKLTPTQVSSLRSLEKKIPTSHGKQQTSYLEQFFATLMGDKIYTDNELARKELVQLKEIAKKKGIKLPSGATKVQYLDVIRRDQYQRQNQVTTMIAQVLTSSLKTALSASILEYTYQNLPYVNASIDEIRNELEKEATEGKIDIEAVHQRELETLKAQSASDREIKRAEARLKAVEGQKSIEARRALKVEETQRTAERRILARQLKDASRLNEITKKINVIVTDAGGVSHPIPIDSLLLDERLAKTMEQIEFTPLLRYLAVETAKTSTHWVPGLGWYQAVIDTTNRGISALEKIKDAYKVINVALQLVDETGESAVDIGEEDIQQLDRLLQHRVPSVTDAIDQLVNLEKVNLKTIVLETLRDKVLFQWDNQRVAYELGKKMLGKEESDMAEDVVRQLGMTMWSMAG